MRIPYTIDLNDVVQHPGRRMEYPIKLWLDREEVPPLAEPIQGTLVAVSSGRLLQLAGEFRTVAWLECARCTQLFRLPVEFHVEEGYALLGTPAALGAHGFARIEDDEPYPLFEQNVLLVEELLRQYLLVQLPMQPVCDPECKGLCPQCGANLNEASCQCEPRKGHPAFQRLAEMWYAGEDQNKK